MASAPCSITKTLQIAFTPPAIAPVNGYIVKWRIVGESTYNTVSPNPTGSPVNVPAVPACENIEGTIQTNCGGGNTGLVATFFVAGEGFPAEYTLIRTNTCISGIGFSSFTLNGATGDEVVLRITMTGAVIYNGTSANGAGVSVSITGNSETDNGESAHTELTTTVGVSANATITFTMPANSVTITTQAIINNSTTSSMMSANVELVSVNDNASTISAGACIGTSTGAW